MLSILLATSALGLDWGNFNPALYAKSKIDIIANSGSGNASLNPIIAVSLKELNVPRLFTDSSVLELLSSNVDSWSDEDFAILYLNYLKAFNKRPPSLAQNDIPFRIFKNSIENIIDTNMEASTLAAGEYPFVGLDDSLDVPMQLNLIPEDPDVVYMKPSLRTSRTVLPAKWHLPDEFPGCFPINNQRDCGSCVIFSGLSAVESNACIHHMKKFGEAWIPNLSRQATMDCAMGAITTPTTMGFPYNNGLGCKGTAPGYIARVAADRGFNGHLCKETPDLLYSARNGLTCIEDCEKEEGMRLINPVSEGFTSIQAVKEHLFTVGPLMIGANFSPSMFYHKTGVWTDRNNECQGTHINHMMALVGYGVENGLPYWLIEQSHGPFAHDRGFFKIEIRDNGKPIGNGDQNNGVCLINKQILKNDVELIAPNGSLKTSTTTTTYWPGKPVQGVCKDTGVNCHIINATNAKEWCPFLMVLPAPDFNYASAICPATCSRYHPSYTCQSYQCLHRDCSGDSYGSNTVAPATVPTVAPATVPTVAPTVPTKTAVATTPAGSCVDTETVRCKNEAYEWNCTKVIDTKTSQPWGAICAKTCSLRAPVMTCAQYTAMGTNAGGNSTVPASTVAPTVPASTGVASTVAPTVAASTTRGGSTGSCVDTSTNCAANAYEWGCNSGTDWQTNKRWSQVCPATCNKRYPSKTCEQWFANK